jgi:hypothetical protein
MLNIDMFIGEFGFEICIHIPVVNYLFQVNLLENVNIMESMVDYYTFIPITQKTILPNQKRIPGPEHLHEIDVLKKIYNLLNFDIQELNANVHAFQYNLISWIPPQYKNDNTIDISDYFKNDKEIIIIYNKYTTEWSSDPINFFGDIELRKMKQMLNSKYNIVYIMPKQNLTNFGYDNQKFIELKTSTILVSIYDLMKFFDIHDFNSIQLQILTQSKKFICVQGGCSRLCSYFGGFNIIYHKKGNETKYDEYNKFKRISNCDINVCNNAESLYKTIYMLFLK